VAPADKRDRIANLAAMNVCKARAKEVPSNDEIEVAVGKNRSLRIDAVSQAGLVVARIGGPGNVDDTG